MKTKYKSYGRREKQRNAMPQPYVIHVETELIDARLAALEARWTDFVEAYNRRDQATWCARCSEYERLNVGMPSAREAAAREKIIRRIVQAKREAGFPLKAVFFDEVWPVALEALKRERSRSKKQQRTTRRAKR